MARTTRRSAAGSDAGASAVEYALVVVAIAAVIVAVVFGLGVVTKGNFSKTCESFNAAQGTSTAC